MASLDDDGRILRGESVLILRVMASGADGTLPTGFVYLAYRVPGAETTVLNIPNESSHAAHLVEFDSRCRPLIIK